MKLDFDNLPEILETERLWLKKYKSGNGSKFYEFMHENEARLRDSFPVSLAACGTRENAELWIKKKVIGWLEHSMFSFAVYDKATGSFIGDSMIKNIDWQVPKAEMGYCISKDHEAKGLMQEVLFTIIEFSFTKLKMEKLYLKIQTTNVRSYRLAERCGFSREGTHKNEYRTYEGHLVDIFYYGLTRDQYFEWKEKKS